MLDRTQTTCPDCRKESVKLTHYASGAKRREYECLRCRGSGLISKAEAARIDEGHQLREMRMELGFTLREEAARLGISARELSDIENGLSETRLRPG